MPMESVSKLQSPLHVTVMLFSENRIWNRAYLQAERSAKALAAFAPLLSKARKVLFFCHITYTNLTQLSFGRRLPFGLEIVSSRLGSPIKVAGTEMR